MRFTDIFIKKPVLATVVSLMILVLGLRSLGLLPVRQYPYTENAIITVSTVYTGADPELVAGFITTALEQSLSQVTGIDYMTSSSVQNVSNITLNLILNYDPEKALADVNSKISAVLNQLPKNALIPFVSIQIGQTIDAMYLGFYSDVLQTNQITDYLVRVVQPKLQTIAGVQQAELRGDKPFAMRIWLDPKKLAGYGISPSDVSSALANNDVLAAVGRTDGNMFTVNLTTSTNLTSVDQFKNMVVKAKGNSIIRLKDISTVSLGATGYDTSVSFNGLKAVYIGMLVEPNANLLTVINDVRKMFPEIQKQLPEGMHAKIVYDSTEFVNSSIREVITSLTEAMVIVTIVIFIFLGSVRSVTIPLVTIPLSLIGAFFVMFFLGYSINLLTLLALVLAIGLVVDDAIIVVENVQRHMEEGMPAFKAAIQGARELANPILAITVVLIAVYVPIGFMGGLTGALFTEFAFTLAGAVTISAIIALTLSPMMCSKWLKPATEDMSGRLVVYIDRQFERLKEKYKEVLHHSLNYLPVTAVFAAIILTSIYFLYANSKSELAPTEDQGIIIAQLTAAPNASLGQTELYSNEVLKIFQSFPETERTFQLNGIGGLNTSIIGMGLTPWDQRKRTSNDLQPLVQEKMQNITGGLAAAFQLPSLPGSRGLPIQFVITTTDPFERLNEVNQEFLEKARATGYFIFSDTDLKIDKAQSTVTLNRDKIAEFGLKMTDIASLLGSALSQAYINYFDFAGRSYQVISQVDRDERYNQRQLLNYYLTTATGVAVPLSTVADIKTIVVPESLNHFQQLNSATFLAVPAPGISDGEALSKLKEIANVVLPAGYYVDYAGQSRQFVQESAALIATFFFALVIIFLALSALFESFRDPVIVLVSVPMSICGALFFICLGLATLNIYTEVGLVTLIGLISKHGILIVQFANDLQLKGMKKREAIETAASIRLRPILMTTAAMVFGVIPLVTATGAGAVSRFNIGLVIGTGLSIGTLFTLFVVPAMYMFLAQDHSKKKALEDEIDDELNPKRV